MLAESARKLDRNAFRLVVFSGTRNMSGVSWLGGCQLILLDAGPGKAQHSRLATDTDILELQGPFSP